jgi:hypothetical protein
VLISIFGGDVGVQVIFPPKAETARVMGQPVSGAGEKRDDGRPVSAGKIHGQSKTLLAYIPDEEELLEAFLQRVHLLNIPVKDYYLIYQGITAQHLLGSRIYQGRDMGLGKFFPQGPEYRHAEKHIANLA